MYCRFSLPKSYTPLLSPQSSLRRQPVHQSRKGNRLPDMVQAADPGHQAFQAQAEPGVRDAAVAAQVQIPFQGFLWEVMFLCGSAEPPGRPRAGSRR